MQHIQRAYGQANPRKSQADFADSRGLGNYSTDKAQYRHKLYLKAPAAAYHSNGNYDSDADGTQARLLKISRKSKHHNKFIAPIDKHSSNIVRLHIRKPIPVEDLTNVGQPAKQDSTI